ncbi:MAG: Ferric transporter ATP-binding subunit [Dehalococcoidia bacterium]|nr:Ferric transporter ATP-binding subunit [Dehalococcoidia bacterium]
MRKLYVVGILLLGLILLVGACAPKAAPSPSAPSPSAPAPTAAPSLGEWDKVLEAARKEGSVTIYNVLGTQLGEALKAGMAKQGIKVEVIGGVGGELELKIVTEQRAKANVADLFISGWTNTYNIAQTGNGQPVNVALPSLQEKDVWRIVPGKYEDTKVSYVFGTSITPSVIANTDLVRKGEITSWNDLLDPKWRDKMVMTDGRTGSGPGASGLWAWTTLGEDFWKKMAAQRITLQARYDIAVNQVAYGEKSIALFPAFSRTVAAIKAGAPVQIVHLKEGTSYYINGIAFVKNAPHPNAALVVLNWMFSKEGQAAIGKATDNYSVRKDLAEDWLRIPELNPGTFTFQEPPNNLDPEASPKGAEYAKKLFWK